jgi:hypothetical protein
MDPVFTDELLVQNIDIRKLISKAARNPHHTSHTICLSSTSVSFVYFCASFYTNTSLFYILDPSLVSAISSAVGGYVAPWQWILRCQHVVCTIKFFSPQGTASSPTISLTKVRGIKAKATRPSEAVKTTVSFW